MRTPPLDDLRFSNTTGILPKKKTMWFIGVEVELIQRRVHSLLKKILDPPLRHHRCCYSDILLLSLMGVLLWLPRPIYAKM